MFTNKGFSLVEILVVIAIVGVVGIILTSIFVSSIRGSNKAAFIETIKRNGQSALETMDKNIRNAKKIVCPFISNSGGIITSNFIVIKTQQDEYFKYTLQPANSTTNGRIESTKMLPTDAELSLIDASCTIANSQDTSNLTDANSQTGVSAYVDGARSFITRNLKEGFNDIVVIDFSVKPGVDAPPAFAGQLDPEVFQTTIQLR